MLIKDALEDIKSKAGKIQHIKGTVYPAFKK